jgi:hypothetical protein
MEPPGMSAELVLLVISTVGAGVAAASDRSLANRLKGFQELTPAAFGTLRDGIDAQVRGFGDRLDGGTKAIDERAATISTKLNDEMALMRSEPVPDARWGLKARVVLRATATAISSTGLYARG